MGDNEFGMSPMREAAVQTHELYEELKRAGFSKREAMELVLGILKSAFENAQND